MKRKISSSYPLNYKIHPQTYFAILWRRLQPPLCPYSALVFSWSWQLQLIGHSRHKTRCDIYVRKVHQDSLAHSWWTQQFIGVPKTCIYNVKPRYVHLKWHKHNNILVIIFQLLIYNLLYRKTVLHLYCYSITPAVLPGWIYHLQFNLHVFLICRRFVQRLFSVH